MNDGDFIGDDGSGGHGCILGLFKPPVKSLIRSIATQPPTPSLKEAKSLGVAIASVAKAQGLEKASDVRVARRLKGAFKVRPPVISGAARNDFRVRHGIKEGFEQIPVRVPTRGGNAPPRMAPASTRPL